MLAVNFKKKILIFIKIIKFYHKHENEKTKSYNHLNNKK
jgi:hypothetical protein